METLKTSFPIGSITAASVFGVLQWVATYYTTALELIARLAAADFRRPLSTVDHAVSLTAKALRFPLVPDPSIGNMRVPSTLLLLNSLVWAAAAFLLIRVLVSQRKKSNMRLD